jgi:cytidylate kinase
VSAPRGRPPTIALDGPAAAGKSTVGRRLAEALDYFFFDTGVLYRALTVLALESGTALDDGPALAALAAAHDVDVRPRPGAGPGYVVSLDETDVTAALRTPAVDRAVSPVSAHVAVRDALLGAQRAVARHGPVVMVGRDIGTAVLPDAALKLYLEASPEARARRRAEELAARGVDLSLAAVHADLLARDAADAGRSAGPLAVAPDAVVVATDDCDADGVVAHLVALVARWPDELTTRGGRSPCGPAR